MIMELLMSNTYSTLVTSQPWHTTSLDEGALREIRDGVIHYIAQLIHQRRPYSSPVWIEELLKVAAAIETRLFYRAQNLEEYRNYTTILLRVQVKFLFSSKHSLRDYNFIKTDVLSISKLLVEELLHTVVAAGFLIASESNRAANPSSAVVGQQAMKFTVIPRVNAPQKEPKPPKTAKPSKANDKEVKDVSFPGIGKSKSTNRPKKIEFVFSQHREKDVGTKDEMANSSSPGASRQVSSQGCSRAFIIKVLLHIGDYVKGKILPSIFTFKKEVIKEWLDVAKTTCGGENFDLEQQYYGGPIYDFDDPSTHWSEPHQLYTWWKNNVERKTKFKVLQQDAGYKGSEIRRVQRARWCEAIVVLSEVIRSSSGSSANARISNLSSLAAAAGILVEDLDDQVDFEADENENEFSYSDERDVSSERRVALAKLGLKPRVSVTEANEVIEVSVNKSSIDISFFIFFS